jgi:hypothetical protein
LYAINVRAAHPFFEKEIARHDHGVVGAIISGTNPVPGSKGGRGRARKARGLPARSRVPAKMVEIRKLGRRRDTTAQDARKVWRVRRPRRRPISGNEKPAAVAGAGFDAFAMMAVCR